MSVNRNGEVIAQVVGSSVDTLRVLRVGEDSEHWLLLTQIGLQDPGSAVHATSDALAQLVCDLGAHVGPVADKVDPVPSWTLPRADAGVRTVFAPAGRVDVVAPGPCTPQDARRLALTLLVAAAVAEQQAGEPS